MRSLGASIYGDPERPRQFLSEERLKLLALPRPKAGKRLPPGVLWARHGRTYWRQTLTVSAASQRAQAGDATAARRLAWREVVISARGRGKHATERIEATWTVLARLRRESGGAACTACEKRMRQAQDTIECYTAQLQAMVGTVPTYVEYRQRVTAEDAAAEAWLRRQLEGLGKGGA